MKKEIFIGFCVGLIATAFGLYLYLEYFTVYGFSESLKIVKKGNLYSNVISIAALANLFVFFIFLKKKQVYRARGVVISTILVALITIVLKFI